MSRSFEVTEAGLRGRWPKHLLPIPNIRLPFFPSPNEPPSFNPHDFMGPGPQQHDPPQPAPETRRYTMQEAMAAQTASAALTDLTNELERPEDQNPVPPGHDRDSLHVHLVTFFPALRPIVAGAVWQDNVPHTLQAALDGLIGMLGPPDYTAILHNIQHVGDLVYQVIGLLHGHRP